LYNNGAVIFEKVTTNWRLLWTLNCILFMYLILKNFKVIKGDL